MFTLIERPLTPSLTLSLPAGAHKLLNAARLEPGATNRRYQELTGYQERSIRSFIAALVEAGLAERVQYQPKKTKVADLSAEQQANFERLRAFGVSDSTARRLASTCSTELVEASLRYVSVAQPRSPAAYLVWCLENPQLWFTAQTQQTQEVESLNAEKATEADEGLGLGVSVGSLQRSLAASPLHEMAPQGVTVTNDNREAILLAYAVEAATGVDVRLNEAAQQTVQSLYQAGYVAEEVGIFTDELFPEQDWRGRKGEKPTLELLRQGIAGTKHRFIPVQSSTLTDGLLKRVQAIRDYLPDDQPIRCLADLWSDEVQQGLVRATHEETHCLECGQWWSLCRCGESEPLPTYTGQDARAWDGLIGQFSVQLNRATFNCWVRDLRLVGFKSGDERDVFTVAVASHYVKDWLEQHLMAAMVETLSKLHQKAVQIDIILEN